MAPLILYTMYVEFIKDSATKETDKKKLLKHIQDTKGLDFTKGEVRYETRGAELVESGYAKEIKDYEAHIGAQKDDKVVKAPKAEEKK